MACELMPLAHSLFKRSNTESPVKQLYQTYLHVSDINATKHDPKSPQCLKNGTDEPICRATTETQMQRIDVLTQQGNRWGRGLC